MDRLKIKDFELSQSFLFFYDKLERCNYFLDCIIQTRAEPLDGRVVAHLLKAPVIDGGQWDMVVTVVEKYGLCPKQAYPDSHASTASLMLNALVKHRLRSFAHDLRRAHEEGGKGAELASLEALKNKQVATMHRLLCLHLGAPPTAFEWRYTDKDGKYKHMGTMTPLHFSAAVVQPRVRDHISLIHDPRNEYHCLYTVQHLGNLVGAPGVRYINLPVDQLKTYVRKTIVDQKKPVWFGCDFGTAHGVDKENGIMSTRIFDYPGVFGTACSDLDKADRLRYGSSLMTHAMMFTAVDIDANDEVVSYRVENSHGKDRGKGGYLQMTAAWFDQFMYQVVVDKALLPPEVLAVLQQTPVVLPPWDPMGSLATN